MLEKVKTSSDRAHSPNTTPGTSSPWDRNVWWGRLAPRRDAEECAGAHPLLAAEVPRVVRPCLEGCGDTRGVAVLRGGATYALPAGRGLRRRAN